MEDNIQSLKDAFHSEFENPANSEPYDSHEGGYLNRDSFVDTELAVQEVFKDNPLPKDVQKELIDELNKTASSWKRKEKD